MKKVLIVIDDINYKGGAHFSTFRIANYLCSIGIRVSIYSPFKIEEETEKYLNSKIKILNKKRYEGYDIVVVPFENSQFREEVARLNGIIKIQWIHIDYDIWNKVVNADIKKNGEVFSDFDQLIFVSEHNMQSFLKYYPALKEKSKVIYNFLDQEEIRVKSEQGFDEDIMGKSSADQLNIVLSGRLEPQKAYHRLIDVVKILNEKNFNISWYILGVGCEYDSLRERCKKYKIKNIHFLGYRKNPYPFVKYADIYAILSEYEGLATVIAESLSVGTPVISTETGGVREVLSDKCGWIVENNLSSILNEIITLYQNRDLINDKREFLKKYQYDNISIEKGLKSIFFTNGVGCRESNDVNMKNIEKNEVDISIVVPVYNMESYLEECLDSLLSQTLKSFEIIIVNDGSTDNSSDIIENYIYHFGDKIRAFTIENGGLGEARNYGISKARGTYLGFVDSDDTVDSTMFEKLYNAALSNHADCVLCDYIATWDTGKQEYVTSILQEHADRFDILKYSSKYGVVNACTKLIHKDLMKRIHFAKGFYEDLATTPIILSYAENIYYLKEGLYFYRQRSDSITSIKSNDPRVFDCYQAWDRILKYANPIYAKEIEFSVYWSMNFFCMNFLDDFIAYSRKYYESKKEVFHSNSLIQAGVASLELVDFERIQAIPKIIHYGWFGKRKKSELVYKCIDSWKKYAPDFTLIEWNEENCNVEEILYAKNAYENGKWKKVSNYFGIKALREMGGIYIDTNTELIHPIEAYIYDEAFFSFETNSKIHGGIMGARAHNCIIDKIYVSYQMFDGKGDSGESFGNRITRIIEANTEFVMNGQAQKIRGVGQLHSSNKMTLNMHDGKNIAHYHYEGDNDNQRSYNHAYEVLEQYFLKEALYEDRNDISDDDISEYYKKLYLDMKTSTSWKITKPLRIIMDIVKKVKGVEGKC